MNKTQICIVASIAVGLAGCAGMSAVPGKRELMVVGNDEKVAVTEAGTFER